MQLGRSQEQEVTAGLTKSVAMTDYLSLTCLLSQTTRRNSDAGRACAPKHLQWQIVSLWLVPALALGLLLACFELTANSSRLAEEWQLSP